VTDGPNSRFQIFEPDGTFVEIWGERGTADGQFNFVRGNGEGFGAIAFAPDGSFWVADTGNARVQHFDADRNFVTAFGERGTNPGQLISAISVGVDSGGNVWVNDDRRGMLVKYGPDGAFLFEVGGPGQEPGSLTVQAVMKVGPDDSVWVTGSTTGFMHRWSSDGTLIGSWEHASLPGNPVWTCSIDFDDAGNLYILDPVGPQVFVMTPEMELLGSWTIANADGTSVPSVLSMIVLSDGSLALPDVEAGTVLIFHLDPPITD
jgi:sugar lactone lactonase YvrE